MKKSITYPYSTKPDSDSGTGQLRIRLHGYSEDSVVYEALEWTLKRLLRQDSIILSDSVGDVNFETIHTPEGELELKLSYNLSLYSHHDMQSLLDAWCFLVEGIRSGVTDPTRVPLVSEHEKCRLLEMGDGNLRNPSSSAHPKLLPSNRTIVENFISLSHTEPDKEAVIDLSGTYTRRELNLFSNKVAHWIIDQNIPTGTAIGVRTPRVKEYAPLALGILKAGCAIVTLEEDYPDARLKQIIGQVGISMILTPDTLVDILNSSISSEDICLCTPASTFQIFFTSGSTGTPKGVIRTLAELTENLNIAIRYGLHPSDAASCQIVNFSFIASVAAFWRPLGYGIPVHVMSPAMVSDQSAFADYLWKHNITYALMSGNYGSKLVNNYDVPLRDLLLSAEKAQPITNTKVRVTNLYACTEFFWATSKILTPGDDHISVGIPTPGTNIYILDEYLNLLPQGVIGEICLSSNTMAKGYLNNPELNNRKFITNPFIPGKRLYRSGDLGFFDENGELNVVGRTDNMVKLRGYRVELDEISHAAVQCRGVNMCACVKKELGSYREANKVLRSGSEIIVCYYTSESGVGEEVLRNFLKDKLPPFMVPQKYVLLDKMPLNANGKIDRKSLPEPCSSHIDIHLPATDDERMVYDVLKKVLGTDLISVTANLISLGLTSLSAMDVVMLLSRKFGKKVKPSELMSNPTVRDIAMKLTDADDADAVEARDLYPLTDDLSYEAALCMANTDKLFFNISYCYHYAAGTLVAERLKKAFEAVIDATPILKTRLEKLDGRYVLRRRDDAHIPVVLEKSNRKPDLNAMNQPFNPMEDDWIRINISEYNGETYLFLSVLHLLADGISLDHFMKRVFDTYYGGHPVKDSYTFYDYLIDTNKKFAPHDNILGDEWYGNLLKRCGTVLRISDKASVFRGIGVQAEQSVILNATDIARRCREAGVTESCLFLTIVIAAFQKLTSKESFVLGIYNNSRYGGGSLLYDMIGYLLSVALVGIDHRIDETALFEEARRVQEQTTKSYALSNYSVSRMVEEKYFSRDDRYIMPYYIYHTRQKETLDNRYAQDGLLIETSPIPGGGYRLTLSYDTNYYSHALIHKLASLIDVAYYEV